MTTELASNNLPEEDLRFEYHIQVFGRFIEVFSLKGGFDLPRALGKGWLGGGFYRTCFLQLMQEFVASAVYTAFSDFFQEQKKKDNNPVAGGITQPVQPSQPLHEFVHEDDLRLESHIRLFGRNLNVFSLNASTSLPGALTPYLGDHYWRDFSALLEMIVIAPARIKSNLFWNERQAAQDKQRRQESKQTFVDNQSWNFGSEDLTMKMEETAAKTPPGKEVQAPAENVGNGPVCNFDSADLTQARAEKPRKAA